MRLDLTDLALFVHVCEAGSITHGAARIHMTLASASERIRAMEERLKLPLLLRQPRGVVPTDAGSMLLRHARRVLAEVDALHGALAAFGSAPPARVRIFANTSGLSDLLPQRLPAFLRAYPEVQVETEEHVSEVIADAVRRGLCDVGIVSDSADLRDLERQPLRTDSLVLAVPADHAFEGSAPLAVAEMSTQPFVGLMEDAAQQQLIERNLAADGTPLIWRLRVRSLEDVCKMVGEGVGLGIVPAVVVRRFGKRHGVRAVALSDAWTRRTLMLCMREAESLSVPARALVQCLLSSPCVR